MSRRAFLKTSALIGTGAAASCIGISAVSAQQIRRPGEPIHIIMAGYGPATTSFSLALKRIGDRLETKFKSDVEVRFVCNILDQGYRGLDILWLVEDGILTKEWNTGFESPGSFRTFDATMIYTSLAKRSHSSC